jgi:hypothetical protein
MVWTIQDAFSKCGKDMHLLARRMTAKKRVNEVAHSIRNLGYTVECGWWEDRGYAGSPEANWGHPEDKRLATTAWNYVISSIRRPSGEYVYGSTEAPLDENGIECRWNSSEVDKRWPLSGHKSLPHYLKTHFTDLVDQSYKLLGPGKTFRIVNGHDGVSGCGLPDWRNVEQFIDAFYLNSSMRAGYKDMYLKKLIGERRVHTIANTLPLDIVETLRNMSNYTLSNWEFMEGAPTPWMRRSTLLMCLLTKKDDPDGEDVLLRLKSLPRELDRNILKYL